MIGISIGSLNTVVGVFKQRNVDVILSDTSERSTPVLVNYDDKERTIGNRALTTIKSNIKRSFNYLTRYLGIKPSNTARLIEEAKYSLNAPAIDSNGDISFEITYKGNNDNYTAESLLGLFFSKLKLNWIKEGYNTNDVVVSVPDYFDITERQAMINSLSIAGLKCVSLINESSAIALSYGLSRQKDLHETDKKVIGFIDMGQSKLNVFYCSFTKSNIKVLSVTSERSCGGREMDYLIAMHLASVFQSKYGCDPMTNQKCRLRLMEAVTKARKQLTVNADVTISIDSLMEGEDLSYLLTREEFISIIAPVIEKYTNVLKSSIGKLEKETQISIQDLHSIEMVGDCVRTPILQSIVKHLYEKDLSKTLLPDECIARGCVLFNVLNNPCIATKNFSLEHYNSNSIYLDYVNAEEEAKQIELFPQGENFPQKKTMTFDNKQVKSITNDGLTLVNITVGTKKNKYDYQIDLKTAPFEDNNPLTIYAELNQSGMWNIAQCKLFSTGTLCEMSSSRNEANLKLEQLIQREQLHGTNDNDFIRVSNRRNEIEEFIYSFKGKISNEFNQYIKPEEKEQLMTHIDSTVDWLYSGEESVYDLNQLEQKYQEISAFTKALQSRVNSWKKLEEKMKGIEAQMAKAEAKTQEAINRKRKHLGLNELKHINAVILYAKRRIGEIKELLNGLRYDLPSLNTEVIEKEFEEINKTIEDDLIKIERKQSGYFRNTFSHGLFDDGLFLLDIH